MHDERENNPASVRSSAALPAVRPLEVTAFRGSNNELYFSMFDMSRVAPQPMAISLPGYFVVAHLDGRRTVAEIQAAFAAEFGRQIEAGQIERVVRALDEALLLNTDRFDRAHAAAVEAYRAGDVRDNRDRWPGADELREQIERMFAAADDSRVRSPAPPDKGGRSEQSAAPPAPEIPIGAVERAFVPASLSGDRPFDPANIAGLIAPHLDYARGAPCYVEAYRALLPDALRRFERFVILGTNHFGRGGGVVATRKDFLTPLGRAVTDRAFIDALESRLDEPLCHHEFDHAAEHSIELHVHILQTLASGSESAAPFTIVPLLIPDPTGPTGTRPLDGIGPDLLDFARALRELMRESDRRTLLVASADLSHVGERFGEGGPTSRAFMKRIGASDKRLLELLENRREEEFVVALAANGNPTRICSIGCLFAMLCALPNRPCRVLRYHQAVDFDNETHVTCAAAVVG